MSDVPDSSDATPIRHPGHRLPGQAGGETTSASGPVSRSADSIPPENGAASSRSEATESPKQRGTILVVDPTPLSLIALAGVLDSDGYSCICARTPSAATEALRLDKFDIVVCDVGDDAPGMLELLATLRSMVGESELPAVLIADQRWAGLEKRTETLGGTTRCLFKPIDPGSLLAVVEQLLWMPQVVAAHRRRGTRPGRPGWVSL